MQKALLRKEMKQRRAALSEEIRESGGRDVCDLVASTPEWQQANTIGLYASFGHEVPTSALFTAAWNAGKRVVIPRVTQRAAPLTFCAIAPESSFTKGAYGIKEPEEGSRIVRVQDIDLLVMPALAMSPTGDRLGWGGGYYDRTLQPVPSLVRFAIIFDCQLLDTIPSQPNDIHIPVVVTPTRILRIGR
jgi:5-formyltetrahydrofolate cyclo-ligase